MRRMRIDLPYLSPETDRHGKPRLYVRMNGRRIRIHEKPGTEAFLGAYKAAVKALKPNRPQAVKALTPHPRGSLGALASAYFGSEEFKALDPTSQRTRRGVIEECLREPFSETDKEPIGNCPLVFFTAAKVKLLRDRKLAEGKKGAANNRRKYIGALFSWAIEDGKATSNPTRDVRRVRYASEGFHAWSVEEVRQFEARHPIGTKARLALSLLLFTGARRGDMVTFGRQHVKDGWLKFIPSKTSYKRLEASEKPILPVLAEVIAQSPCGDLTFLVTEYGRPFTANGFGNWFRDRCNEAGLPQCSAHGLRKAGATMAAENGATGPQLQAIFDWSTLAQAQAYIEKANRKKMAGDAMGKLVAGTN